MPPADDHDTVDLMATGASGTLDTRIDLVEVSAAANAAAITALALRVTALEEA